MAALGFVVATASSIASAPAVVAEGHASTLVVFDPAQGQLPEGVALDAEGNAFASLPALGELVRSPAESAETQSFGRIEGLAPGDAGPIGLAVDLEGNVYSGVRSADPALNGAWRFDASTGEAFRIEGSGGIAFANDVALGPDGTLYITDTIAGTVWRAEPGGPAELWAEAELLQGTGEAGFGFPIGANGIAVVDDIVYVGVTERAHIVAVPVNEDGTSGVAEIFAQLPEAVDGIAIDAEGNLFSAHPIANLVTRRTPAGEVEVIATESDGLDRPSTIALQTEKDGTTTVIVANFSIAMGTPLGHGPSLLTLQLTGS